MSKREPEVIEAPGSARPWAVVVWDDPINLERYSEVVDLLAGSWLPAM